MSYRPRRAVPAAAAILGLLLAASARSDVPAAQDRETVGPQGPGRTVLPVNQVVTPYGVQTSLPGLRPLALALSPDGRLLAAAGKTPELIILDARTGRFKQRVALPSEEQQDYPPETVSPMILDPDEKGQLSYTGLVFSPDGRLIYMSNVNGSIKVFAVGRDGAVQPSHAIPLPPAGAPGRAEEIPSGLALTPDGRTLYVCGNLSNRLLEIDAGSAKVTRTFDVGVAPFAVVLARGKAYVSNWGGRRPGPGDLTGPAGQGTEVRVDPVRHIASEGSVSVIDLAAGSVVREVLVQLHASALAVSPDGRWVVCANAASDNLSVIDTATDAVAETIWVKASPADLFGASPNALAFAAKGKTLYAANGTQNAVAVIKFSPAKRKSWLKGLIPVGWFPGALALNARRGVLCVANVKGQALERIPYKQTGAPGFNSHQHNGSVSMFPIPNAGTLRDLTRVVYANYQRERLAQAFLQPRPGQPARPVPERIGEPSVFKHVVYVIKENRTYDQVLGDVRAGNGDPDLCIFGEKTTPNQHKLVREFVLLDNTYCSGILSADGHQWSTTAFGTDYLERSFAGWPRSYPDGMGPDEIDALAYAPSGFIWDNALKHGVSLWNFGEFTMQDCGWKDPARRDEPKWADYWDEYLNGRGLVRIGSRPAIPSVAPFSPTDTLGWNMAVPDQWRARYIVDQVAAWDREGRMPQLILVCLPDDHTSGTSEGSPTPEACAADNDLAFGRIVEAFSRSSFWKETVIFGIEDDPQNGWDHVSGYRTTAYCASPYTKRGAVISTRYNTTSLLRTIEQILGLPPMNQFDATATPMFDCFAETPDFAPFEPVPANIPLDTMNPPKSRIADALLRRQAVQSGRLNFRQVDACPEDILNRILWHAVKGPSAPYPAWAVTLVEEDDD
ncbi:MAG TPA: bifunctional YncE family protein/alkaline phosphatase family protein [Candidatus Aminicenantes bacterium]|nr:bifunctional YncE family protein/alkaline phosphatase family protein [Candidatus Aminicenantes bacterium]HRY64947.1 bifunctional YncE family protein/alkaline phosphatase family protein [Candidatus Aminicenantes bacterium]HRZ71860.1 bifunctional YncE family protein/alkaline phosphatase family protein [Candidatus Aminicenantes bacterium]